jgi:hypothetical protein
MFGQLLQNKNKIITVLHSEFGCYRAAQCNTVDSDAPNRASKPGPMWAGIPGNMGRVLCAGFFIRIKF